MEDNNQDMEDSNQDMEDNSQDMEHNNQDIKDNSQDIKDDPLWDEMSRQIDILTTEGGGGDGVGLNPCSRLHLPPCLLPPPPPPRPLHPPPPPPWYTFQNWYHVPRYVHPYGAMDTARSGTGVFHPRNPLEDDRHHHSTQPSSSVPESSTPKENKDPSNPDISK